VVSSRILTHCSPPNSISNLFSGRQRHTTRMLLDSPWFFFDMNTLRAWSLFFSADFGKAVNFNAFHFPLLFFLPEFNHSLSVFLFEFSFFLNFSQIVHSPLSACPKDKGRQCVSFCLQFLYLELIADYEFSSFISTPEELISTFRFLLEIAWILKKYISLLIFFARKDKWCTSFKCISIRKEIILFFIYYFEFMKPVFFYFQTIPLRENTALITTQQNRTIYNHTLT